MRNNELFMSAENIVTMIEDNYFAEGAFRESIVRFDMETRPGQKRDFYINDFSNILEFIDKTLLDAQENDWGDEFISRCEECKEQVHNLLDIVRG